ncbi:branched-chain amino acid aminotransferase [bacterium]|nr:MAG: branched-chain amino acid aminotransferase [bacterium]
MDAIEDKIKVKRAKESKLNNVNWDTLGFGKVFSDHIFVADYKNGNWQEGHILPYGEMAIEPTMCTLHYGQTIFEGLKAYNDISGGINIFRPDRNAKRFNNSATRLVMPNFPEERFLEAVSELVSLEKDWIPKQRGQALYIRPVMYGSSNFLGVHSSENYKLIIICSPVASYYATGLKPVSILVSHEYVRAVRGGLGMAKTAANYAASLLAGKEAKAKGFDQVLWLDGVHQEYVDEVGAMNIMFVIGDELITPTLEQGSILPGVTRETVLALAKEKGIKTSERRIRISEVFDAHDRGELKEVFGTGTAAIISPVGRLNYKGKEIIINNDEIGPIAHDMYETIVGIQRGETEDTHGWNYKIMNI